MSIKVGINGFGRIGRMVFRASINHPEIEIVGINDLCPADYLAYMLKYDTIHGKFEGTVDYTENSLIVNGKAIRVTCEKDPANLKWDEVGAEYVVESTGLFLTKEKAQAHIDAGVLRGDLRERVGTDVKADDDRVGGICQHHVVLGHGTDSTMDDTHAHLLVGQLLQRLGNGFHRALHVCLDDDGQFLHLAFVELIEQVIQRYLLVAG